MIAAVAGLLLAGGGWGAELSPEKCAETLQKSTVTVRIRLRPPAKEASADYGESDEAADNAESSAQVSVCSGVAVADRFVVTAAFAAADSQIRITLPGGQQANAQLRVLDEFSGLALLEAREAQLTKLEFASEPPVAGNWVMAAAGWGTEQPLVSVGVVGGVERTLKGYVYPPLIQCDVRPAETSGGAGIINRQGQLLGIIVAADGPEVHRGWSYAVPVSHVQRLLRTRDERSREDSVVVLKRRRPTVGVVLESGDTGVTVSRVVPASPAEKAGIKPGDRIVHAEGIKVRSVYEAVRPTLYKQPGDTMTFLLQRGDEQKKVELVLGGGVELPGASLNVLGQLIAPKIDLGITTPRNRSQALQAAEVTIREAYSAAPVDKDAAPSPEKVRVLEKANERYRMVIDQQQRELARREEERRQQTEVIESLKAELKANQKKPGISK
jgi:S1-C subfamily serine protease